VGTVYDSGNLPGLLAKIKELTGYEGLRREQERLRAQGVLMGIGLGCFFDIGGFGPSQLCAKWGGRMGWWESASLRVHPSGKATLFCGTHSHGQAHATTFSQIAADRLGIPMEDIEVVEGDTDRIPFGLGTYASRSLTLAGPAILKAADRVIEKGARLAAHLLECSQDDLDYGEGSYRVRETNRHLSFQDVARAAYMGASYPEGFELGLEETSFYDPEDFNYPSGIHLCVVLVDPETGSVRIRDYAAVDDVGTVINPMVVEGQVHGGIAQGVGQALMEHVVYDGESGQLLTGSFMDYCMPRADDLPSIAHGFQETPCPTNPLGAKAVGECGTIGAPATVANAVVDALWHLGVRHVDMPITPMRVWNAIREARS
jgi:carbon-monoxide dehydrogenase large subunit